MTTRRRLSCIVLLSLPLYFLSSSLYAEHTRRWLQNTYEEFLKGTAHGVAVRSDGRLELAPKFTLLSDADASYLWSLRVDPKGALYAAGGSPAKVFRFESATANSKPTTVFESSDLVAQAIAFDSKGSLYVATSPDGKVYRVNANGEKSVFFDPKAKYIWDLAFGADGNLYIATGDKGQIFSVSPDGKGELFYASDEAHMKVLAFDKDSNLIAGTEPNGRVLRITKAGAKSAAKEGSDKDQNSASGARGFVLYETSKREITALAVAPNGSIYVGAIGEKQHNIGVPVTPTVSPAATATITTSTGSAVITSAPQAQTPFVAFPPALSSSIYRIAPDGVPDELWSSRDDIVYSLGLAPDGRVLAGTGNNGTLLAIDGHGVFAQLAKSGSAQITGIVQSSGRKLFLCTANPGKVFSLGPDYEPEGTFESRSFDAQLFSQWGRLDWWGPSQSDASTKLGAKSDEPRLEFFVRSGNTEEPSKEWSRWFGPYSKPTTVEAPPARFFQWRAVIHGARPGDGINWVSMAYLPSNVAPVIDAIAIQDPGVRAQATAVISAGQSPTVALKLPPTPATPNVFIAQSTPIKFEQPPQGYREKGYQSVLWSAHDDNDDDLRYTIYYRGENEAAWKILKDKLDQKFYAFDTTTLPDGAYYLKIVASDALSNPPQLALETSRESDRFEVDNTPPTIEQLDATLVISKGGSASTPSLLAQFSARDSASGIDRAQYSLDGADWLLLSPASKVSDDPEERYEFSIPTPTPGEHTIAVRAYDRFDNVGSAKTTVTVPARP
jgi:outer membrane protein assembly factor BamB